MRRTVSVSRCGASAHGSRPQVDGSREDGAGGGAGARNSCGMGLASPNELPVSSYRVFPIGKRFCNAMLIIAKRTLKLFWERHPRAEAPLRVWYSLVNGAGWNTPADVKAMFRAADFAGDNQVVFVIGGSKFRLVARVAYSHKRVLITFVGIHNEDDTSKPEAV